MRGLNGDRIFGVYTKEGCPSCVRVKELLSSHGIQYKEYDVSDDEQRAVFYEQTGLNSVPQVYLTQGVVTHRLGGFEDTAGYFRKMQGMTQPSTSYKPFKYPALVDLSVMHERMHWTEEEVSLGQDVEQWKTGKISEDEKAFIVNILRLFTQSDVAVASNYGDLFIPLYKNNEVRNWLYSVAARESVHQRAYALLNDTLGLPEVEYAKFLEIGAMADKASFMRNDLSHAPRDVAISLARSMISEGMFLFASFAMLMSLSRQGKLQSGMQTVVEWSVRDEDVHCQGLEIIFREQCRENPHIVDDNFKAEIYGMFRDAVQLEDQFIDYVFADYDLPSINKEDLKQYVRFIADRRLVQLGMKANFGVEKNPLPWMAELLGGVTHANFFEARVTDYSKKGMSGEFSYDFLT